MSKFSWLPALIACGACALDNSIVLAPSLDRAMFAAQIQPVLATRCASPACHGNERRRLRVYSPGLFRADPSRTHVDEALSANELEANARSAESFAADVPVARESLLVRKSLGDAGHLGGRVLTESDRDALALVAWLRTGGAR
ncbi:MAG: hypothetical protein U0269_00175 [Polyangiales bacterium]